MKRMKFSNVLLAVLFISICGLVFISPALAVEEHHPQQPGAQKPVAEQPNTTGPQQGPAMMGGSGMPGGPGQGMMGSGASGGMGMMGGGSGGGMMGPGMMRMMMSHMMGGPGGMGKMMGGMGSGGGKDRGRGMMARMTDMLEQLNLTPEQWNKVRKLARERLEKMVDLWAMRTKLEIELSSLRWDQKLDAKRVKELFIQKAGAQADMFLAGLEYLRGLKSILTPEQAKKLEGRNLQ